MLQKERIKSSWEYREWDFIVSIPTPYPVFRLFVCLLFFSYVAQYSFLFKKRKISLVENRRRILKENDRDVINFVEKTDNL